MKQRTYVLFGIIIIIISLVLSATWIPENIRNHMSIWVDGIWLMILAFVSAFLLGVLFLFFGFGKFKINTLSDKSLKFMIAGLGISIIGFSLLLLISGLTGNIGFLWLGIPLLPISYLCVIISLILLIISIFK
ncbi:MAG TPA: hypothetical protein VJH20_05575 [Candidatus Nanoarchaeia archaeon]|nr:hypothetical protein [Candidatus Nanoarchaeia archaeon]